MPDIDHKLIIWLLAIGQGFQTFAFYRWMVAARALEEACDELILSLASRLAELETSDESRNAALEIFRFITKKRIDRKKRKPTFSRFLGGNS